MIDLTRQSPRILKRTRILLWARTWLGLRGKKYASCYHGWRYAERHGRSAGTTTLRDFQIKRVVRVYREPR